MSERRKLSSYMRGECRPTSSVLTRYITPQEVLPAIGEQASLGELQEYVSRNVAKEVGRVIQAENVVGGLMAPDAARIHISFSWG